MTLKLPHTLTLKCPLKTPDGDITSLTFDEATIDAQIGFAELRATFSDPATDADEMKAARFWVAALCEQPVAVIGSMRGEDAKSVQRIVGQIMGFDDGGAEVGNEIPPE